MGNTSVVHTPSITAGEKIGLGNDVAAHSTFLATKLSIFTTCSGKPNSSEAFLNASSKISLAGSVIA
jgi:hypothetical protein